MMFGLSQEVIDQIHGVLAQHPQVQEALIYGSRAKGNYKPGSDIDLVLCGDQSLNMDVLLRIMWELEELPQPYTFDVCIYHQIDAPELLDHIRRVGKPFYRRERPPHEDLQVES